MTVNDGFMYCPVCGRELEASNKAEVSAGDHGWHIFVHDDIEHSESDMLALEHGMN